LRLLLDTHIVLWRITDNPRLPARARTIIDEEAVSIDVSAISVWEVAIKWAQRRGRANDMPLSGKQFLHELDLALIAPLPVQPLHAAAMDDLPAIHGDPFDRFLIATARHEGMTLLTRDARLADWPTMATTSLSCEGKWALTRHRYLTLQRHPELVSGLIAPPGPKPRGEKWALKRVQGDGKGWWGALVLPLLWIASPALAQEHDHSTMGHDRPVTDEIVFADPVIPFSAGSGTSRLPGVGSSMAGLHVMAGDWMLMAHGFVTAQYTDHSGPRGDDKFYSTSMIMLNAERPTDWGRVLLKSMLSLEPAMKAKGYPNLFATGETANGAPLVDRQHPHDLFMELAARVDVNLGDGGTTAFLYGGPVGEPALGPSAFMMRQSARYNPEPPIAHHWFDSTHITYGVVTAGLSSPRWQIEASAFRGREPDEERWDIETPKLDSWSVRATLTPSPRWAIQASYAQIAEPEALHAGQDERRFTASAHYADGRGLSAMTGFSAKTRVPGDRLTAYLAEVTWDLDRRNTMFGRAENVANDELFPDHDDPLHDARFRLTKLQAGYARRIPLGRFELALGGSLSAYAKPEALDTAYGDNPWGYTLFAKLSLGH